LSQLFLSALRAGLLLPQALIRACSPLPLLKQGPHKRALLLSLSAAEIFSVPCALSRA